MFYEDLKAKEYASRCLSCKNPSCELGCPIKNHIRDFIKAIKDDDTEKGAKIIYDNSILAFICSVVCPHENHCEGHCILNKAKKEPVKIGYLEAYLTHKYDDPINIGNSNGKKVLVVGSGPGGIYSSIMLRKNGFSVDLIEKEDRIGGVLSYGIPNYRFSDEDLERLNNLIKQYQITTKLNTYLDETKILKLKEEYDYIILACGLTKSKDARLGSSKRIIGATDYLKEYNYYEKYKIGNKLDYGKKAIVVGAGNVAMDVSRSLRRLGLDVEIVYRRSELEAPATKLEIKEAKEEGVIFSFLENPVSVVEKSDGINVKIEKMRLGEPDSSGRRRPEGTGEYIYKEADYLFSAIGQDPDSNLHFEQIKTDYGYVVADETFKTNIPGIYVVGDLTLGARTVVEACNSAKVVVEDILKKI